MNSDDSNDFDVWIDRAAHLPEFARDAVKVTVNQLRTALAKGDAARVAELLEWLKQNVGAAN